MLLEEGGEQRPACSVAISSFLFDLTFEVCGLLLTRTPGLRIKYDTQIYRARYGDGCGRRKMVTWTLSLVQGPILIFKVKIS